MAWKTFFQKQKARAGELKRDTVAVMLACKDHRVPWYAKALALVIAAYALSPIDLIPDFVPVIGYLDDLLIIPLGILLVLKMVPPEVMADCRRKVDEGAPASQTAGRVAALIIASLWVGVAAYLAIRYGSLLTDWVRARLTRFR